ncbi:MAG TPA: Bax inhibitor-1/YccA family protein [Steroidobacteraceae bacterium]|jgi:uncharacterized YccA/Bax inhibitor family protein|nr:Bax inhibitor-1/YccA family protein [Steroidobacteraceae bacterium]
MADRNLPIRSTNPTLNDRTFDGLPRALAGEAMTLQGAINKSFVLLLVLMGTALYPWSQYMASGNAGDVALPLVLGLFGGLILALIISFKSTLAPYLSIPYAACEGLAIGGISAMFERRFPGIAIQAVGLTFGVMAALLFAYTSRLIRVTQTFRSVVVGATFGIMLFYLASWILSLFHVNIGLLTGVGTLSILVSLAVVVVAALNLVLSFDLIENGVAQGAPRYMEWYCAFGLLVTLVWLYMEILNLLAKVRQR